MGGANQDLVGTYAVEIAGEADAKKWATVYSGVRGRVMAPLISKRRGTIELWYSRHLAFEADPDAWYRVVWREPKGVHGVVHGPVQVKRLKYESAMPSRATLFLGA